MKPLFALILLLMAGNVIGQSKSGNLNVRLSGEYLCPVLTILGNISYSVDFISENQVYFSFNDYKQKLTYQINGKNLEITSVKEGTSVWTITSDGGISPKTNPDSYEICYPKMLMLEKQRIIKQNYILAEKKKAAELIAKREADKAEQDEKARIAELARIKLEQQKQEEDIKQNSFPNSRYLIKLIISVKAFITFPGYLLQDIEGNPQAEVEVSCDNQGNITQMRLIKSSGYQSWDQAVLNAIQKLSRLPIGADGKVPSKVTFSLRPRDH